MSLQAKLRDLFLLDQQLRGLRSRLDSAAGRLRAQQGKLARLSQQRTELAEQHKQTQAKAAAFEHQARDIEERIARLRDQMNTVKNNKEYSALLIEVNTFKLDKGKVEDQALEQMGKVEALAGEVKDIDAKVEEQRKLVGVSEKEVTDCQTEIGAQLADLTTRRNAAEAELPEEARATFNRIAEIHEGETMAPVVEESRRHMEYSCGGCYMSIPVERLNALMMRDDQIVLCPNCSRLLYVDQDLKASMGTK